MFISRKRCFKAMDHQKKIYYLIDYQDIFIIFMEYYLNSFISHRS